MSKVYDLEERTAKFGENIISLAKLIPETTVNRSLVGQIVRSGTSVGANYLEADTAISKKDFRFKISICRKEAKETKHWLRMLMVSSPSIKDELLRLSREAMELVLIFSAVLKS